MSKILWGEGGAEGVAVITAPELFLGIVAEEPAFFRTAELPAEATEEAGEP